MATLTQSCVAQYKMRDLARSTVIRNSRYSTSSPHGVSIRNTQFMSVAGPFTGALEFDGTADYIDTGQTFEATFQDSFTITGHFKINDGVPATERVLIGLTDIGGRCAMECYITIAGKLCFEYESANDYLYARTADGYFTNGALDWHLFKMVVEKISAATAQASVYVDGVLAATSGVQSCVMADYATTLCPQIGAVVTDDSSIQSFFDGAIANVCIFNRVLTTAEDALLATTENLTDEPYSVAETTLAAMLAACTRFADECTTAPENYIFIGKGPGDSDFADVMGLVCRTGEDNSKSAGTGSKLHGGSLELRLEKTIPSALQGDDAAALAEFGEWVGDIIEQLWEQSYLAGGLILRSIDITEGPGRYDDQEHKNICGVKMDVRWGFE